MRPDAGAHEVELEAVRALERAEQAERDAARARRVVVAVPAGAVVVTEAQLTHMHAIWHEDGTLRALDGRPIYVVREVTL